MSGGYFSLGQVLGGGGKESICPGEEGGGYVLELREI